VEFPGSCLNSDNRTRQVDEGAVMLGFSLPAYSQATKVVVPAVGTFDDPASRFATNATNKRRLAPAANVRLHTALTCLLLAIVVVVPLVQADVLGPPPSGDTQNRPVVDI